MSHLEKLKADFNEFVENEQQDGGKIAENEDWLKDFSLEEDTVTFHADVTFTDEFHPIKIQVPSTYPSGNFKYTLLNLTKTIKGESLEDVIDQILSACEEKREIALNSLVTPTPKDQAESPWGTNPGVWGEVDEETMKETQHKIAKDIAKLHEGAVDGWFAQAGQFGNNQCWIYLFLDPKKRIDISSTVADAWGLHMDKLISVSLTFSSLYTESTLAPEVSCFQSGKSGIKKLDGSSELLDKSGWGLDWTVENRIKQKFLKEYWPLQKNFDSKKFNGKNYLFVLMDFIEETVKNCSSRCCKEFTMV
jgi:hypothetical protein